MIFKKLAGYAAAIAAIAAAAAVVVVALAFALYAAVRDLIGPAWGAAAVAGAAALIALILALVLTRKAGPSKSKTAAPEPPSLTAKAIDLAKERPLVALGAAAAVVAVMIRNPKILGAVAAAALAPRAPPPKK